MTDTETIATAIDRSLRQNEIVTLYAGADFDDDFDPQAELLALCEDSADNGEILEFWGRDADGDEWRVHLDVSQ